MLRFSTLTQLPRLLFAPFSPSGELVQIMMVTANENLSAKFCNRVLKFFTKLFQLSKCTLVKVTPHQRQQTFPL